MPDNKAISAISRRALLAGGAALSVLPTPRASAQSPQPLKIGFLTVETGPLAAGGKQQDEGAALFLKERGGMIAGRKVELITQDTAGNTSLARTKTQELVERYKVPVIGGDRRPEGASGESVGAARLRHRAAGDLSARRLCGQDARL